MGILYIIATPIGNLGDIALRALETLKEVDLVVCEDTRQTLKLLNHYDIKKPLVSYFQYSKLSKVEYIAEQLKSGKKVALVTDAGTPGISDPGGKLIEELLALVAGEPFAFDQPHQPLPFGRRSSLKDRPRLTGSLLKVIPIPGPCAAIAALSVSGFPTDKFVFMGFPPHKKGREKYFKEIAAAEQTVVFYESTHRILKTLEQLASVVPSRQIMVAREITKMFESFYRGSAEDILKELKSDKNNQKGEFVIIISK
jgi:16S rRNA (cytidine1402-2'-O)-methyltransferase